jgi:hypothetical protein
VWSLWTVESGAADAMTANPCLKSGFSPVMPKIELIFQVGALFHLLLS